MFKTICTVALAVVLSLLVERLNIRWLTGILIYLGIYLSIICIDAVVAKLRQDRKTHDSIKGSL